MKSINITRIPYLEYIGKTSYNGKLNKGLDLVFQTSINDLMVIGGQIRLEGENIELNFLHPTPKEEL